LTILPAASPSGDPSGDPAGAPSGDPAGDPARDPSGVPAARNARTIALIVAVALLMQNIDGSVLGTALPRMAVDLGADPIHLKFAVTSYLLALAIFIPASGWVADRFGARRVFRIAIAVFAGGSILCGLADSLPQLIAARVLQGIGGSMMMPVGRLIVLRATPRAGLVAALAWLTAPALLGPVLGPPLGGYFTTYHDWRWIFWINVPLAALGLVLATLFIPDIRARTAPRFDFIGFALLGPGLASLMTGVTLAGLNLAPPALVAGLIAAGAALTLGYGRHALRVSAPLVDLRLMALPTFRASQVGGTLFRSGSGAMPFLLPLLFQLGFGMTALQSGLLTFVSGLGALAMKFVAHPILRRFGFRRVLMVNAVVSAAFIAAPAGFGPQTPWALMIGLLFLGGVSRSLQFTCVQAFAYADVPEDRLSSATSFSAAMQELSISLGVTLAALALEAGMALDGVQVIAPSHFPWAFGLAGAVALSSGAVFAALAAASGSALIAGGRAAK